MRFDKQFLMKALPNAIFRHETFPRYPNVAVDSRSTAPGDLFVALKGRRVDGHDFVQEALAKGAVGLIVEEAKIAVLEKLNPLELKDKLVVVVKDSLQALVQLATAWRSQFSYPVVGITGSVGKSSTKEMVRNILDEAGLANCVSYGNQNSIIGASISVLKMREKHQVAVFEMGINNRGEMAQLVEIVKPTIGLITGLGHSHMAGLGALVDIAEEKRNIFKLFKADNIGIINGDQALLSQIGYTHPVIKFGLKTTNQIQARKIIVTGHKAQFTLKIYQEKYRDVRVCGSYEGAVYNALGAAAVGCLLSIPNDVIVRGVQQPVSLPGRFELKTIMTGRGGTLVDDCYNASPESMKAALLSFDKMLAEGSKVVVLGDMNELGVDAPFWHRQIGRVLSKLASLDQLILIGKYIKEVVKTLPPSLRVAEFDDWESGVSYLQDRLKTESLSILVKGSTRAHTEGLAKLARALTSMPSESKLVVKATRQKNLANLGSTI